MTLHVQVHALWGIHLAFWFVCARARACVAHARACAGRPDWTPTWMPMLSRTYGCGRRRRHSSCISPCYGGGSALRERIVRLVSPQTFRDNDLLTTGFTPIQVTVVAVRWTGPSPDPVARPGDSEAPAGGPGAGGIGLGRQACRTRAPSRMLCGKLDPTSANTPRVCGVQREAEGRVLTRYSAR